MFNVADSLWPTTFSDTEPSAVKILRDQAAALKELTRGVLYGEVSESAIPSPTGLALYDFFICIDGKEYDQKLLSVECPRNLDYPILINNDLAGTIIRVSTEEAFKKRLRELFSSEMTKETIRRMLAIAQ